MRRRDTAIEWPPGLAVCVLEDWLEPGETRIDLWGLVCWQRWVSARFDYLTVSGYGRDDAQQLAVGDMPANIDGRLERNLPRDN